jgi:hypothetical protein
MTRASRLNVAASGLAQRGRTGRSGRTIIAVALGVGLLAAAAELSGLGLGSTGQPTSVRFTETQRVESRNGTRLNVSDGFPRLVVDTTIGSERPTAVSFEYQSRLPGRPFLRWEETERDGTVAEYDRNSWAVGEFCFRSAGLNQGCTATSRPWIEVPGSPGLMGWTASGASTLSKMYDPAQLFAELSRSVRHFARVGTAAIAGATTTAYGGVLPAQSERQLDLAPASEEQILELAIPGDSATWGIGASVSSLTVRFKSVPIEIWVDTHGVVRQVRVTTPEIVSGMGSNQIVPVVVTLSYSDFDAPIPLAPSAGEVFVAPAQPGSGGWSASEAN